MTALKKCQTKEGDCVSTVFIFSKSHKSLFPSNCCFSTFLISSLHPSFSHNLTSLSTNAAYKISCLKTPFLFLLSFSNNYVYCFIFPSPCYPDYSKLSTHTLLQAVCEWGHESVESWGRRKRSMASNHTANESEDDMTLSQEILVLDFGDEKNSQFLRSEASSSDFSKGE